MPRVDADFKKRVYDVVDKIPQGMLTTYGTIAATCGAAWAAWEVGQIAHTGPENLPWQRVVTKDGRLAKGYPGGIEGHKRALEIEGVKVDNDYRVNIEEYLWRP